MQDSGYGYPPVEDRGQVIPTSSFCQRWLRRTRTFPPEPIDALSEGAQLTDIPGNSIGIGSSQ